MSTTTPALPSPARSRPTGAAGPRPAGPAGTRPGGTASQWPSRRAHRLAAMAHGFVALFLEVEAGCRPRRQLEPLFSPILYARLGDVWVRPGPLGRVVSLHVTDIGRDVCDAVAIVRRGERCGALGLRLARSHPGCWLVVDLARPEDGHLPDPAYVAPVHREDPDETDDVTLAVDVLLQAASPPAQA